MTDVPSLHFYLVLWSTNDLCTEWHQNLWSLAAINIQHWPDTANTSSAVTGSLCERPLGVTSQLRTTIQTNVNCVIKPGQYQNVPTPYFSEMTIPPPPIFLGNIQVYFSFEQFSKFISLYERKFKVGFW